jgi:hypothetical protein
MAWMAPPAVPSLDATTASTLLLTRVSAFSMILRASMACQSLANWSETTVMSFLSMSGLSGFICPSRRSSALLSAGEPPMST